MTARASRSVGLTVSLILMALAAQAQPLQRSFAGHYELVAPLTQGLAADDDAVRARCAFLLGQIGDPRAARPIRPLLRDASRAVRYQAGIALCALKDEAGLKTADAALESAAEWIRYYAVHALAALCSETARVALEAQRPDQGELIREQIDEALESWPWPSVPPEPAQEKMGPYDSLHELFIDATDPLMTESDWHWHRGKYLECVRCNEAAAFLDPHYVDLYGTSAWLLWSLGLNERAVSTLRQGIAANPESWDMWFDAGMQYSLMKEHTTAARLFGRAFELGAPAVQSRQYCHALEKSGRPDLALKAWQGLLETYPDDPLAPGHIERLKKLLSNTPTENA